MGKKINVYCGLSISDKCGKQSHPLIDVKKAIKILESKNIGVVYTNSPDFVSAIKHMSDVMGINVEFFLNNVSCGNDIEPIFEDFNKSLGYLEKMYKKIKKNG